jgi:hypothetical protein
VFCDQIGEEEGKIQSNQKKDSDTDEQYEVVCGDGGGGIQGSLASLADIIIYQCGEAEHEDKTLLREHE